MCSLSACQHLNVPVQSAEILAINVGGDTIIGADAITYQSDQALVTGGDARQISEIRGTQIPQIYQTYRSGTFELGVPMQKGAYDISLLFAEPDEIAVGERIFDVLIEGEPRIEHLDVQAARSDQIHAAFSHTIPAVTVNDGQLDLSFQAHTGKPILSGVVIRRHTPVDRSNLNLVWSDEFNRDGALDPNLWTHEIWKARTVNDEAQAYTDRPRNVRIEDGKLIIEAHKEAYDGAAYTSARIHSAGKGDLFYGRIEVRAKLPMGGGTWPAIWMMPTDRQRYAEVCSGPQDWDNDGFCAGWPNSGEIDIMEHVGNDPGVVHGTVHTKAYYWVNGKQRKGSVRPEAAGDAFHVYAIYWTEDRLVVSVDDTVYFTYLREDGADWQAWPFDHPYHLILNLAVGGNWGGADGGITASDFPQRLEIDYVRAYAWPE